MYRVYLHSHTPSTESEYDLILKPSPIIDEDNLELFNRTNKFREQLYKLCESFENSKRILVISDKRFFHALTEGKWDGNGLYEMILIKNTLNIPRIKMNSPSL